jgi:hypothetical protein
MILLPLPFKTEWISIGVKKARMVVHIGKRGDFSMRNKIQASTYNQVISIIPAEINNNVLLLFGPSVITMPSNYSFKV